MADPLAERLGQHIVVDNPEPNTAEEFTALIRNDIAKWAMNTDFLRPV